MTPIKRLPQRFYATQMSPSAQIKMESLESSFAVPLITLKPTHIMMIESVPKTKFVMKRTFYYFWKRSLLNHKPFVCF